jgi:hypothetical protein
MEQRMEEFGIRKAEKRTKSKARSAMRAGIRGIKKLPRKVTEQHGKIQFVNTLLQCNSVKIRGEKIKNKS